MAVKQLEDFCDVGVGILGSDVSDNGTISCQTGDAISGSVSSANAEWWQTVGLASRPAKAVQGSGSAQAVTLNRGDRDCIIASKDIRGQAIYGNLKDGECCVYAPGAQGKTMYKADGSVTMYTTDDNTPNGNGVYFQVTPTKLQFIAPWGKLTFDATGLHIVDSASNRIDMGPMSDPTGVLSTVLPGYLRVTSAWATVNSPLIVLAPDNSVLASVVNTITPAPPLPAGTILCGSPGSPTVPPLNAATGVFVSST